MSDDLVITLAAEEPPEQGTNMTLRYGNDNLTGRFSLSAVADPVTQLNNALTQIEPSLESVKDAGATLFEALLDRQHYGLFIRATTHAVEQDRKVRLRINSERGELAAIPWEYLYDRGRERWVARDPQLSLIRSLPVISREPQAVEDELRVLVMISDPTDLPSLDSQTEWDNLQAIADVASINLISVEPTYEALIGALRQEPHVFHFVGHGIFTDDAQVQIAGATRHVRLHSPVVDEKEPIERGYLAFTGADKKTVLVSADEVAALLSGCQSLRLALLNSCQGSTTGNRSAFAGVAQKLIQQGLPAVVAMQAPILDTDALRFSQEFYRALADGFDLEASLAEGRKRLAEQSAAWGIPTLYSQGSEPFSIPKLSDAEKAERLWQRVQPIEEPERRRRLLDQILVLAPEQQEAKAAIERMAHQEEAAHLYAAAIAYIESENWREAYRALDNIERQTPNYSDVRRRLSETLGKLGDGPAEETFDYDAQVEKYRPILNALKEGRLTPFLGRDVSLLGRPAADQWVAGLYPPSAADAAHVLADYLPQEFTQTDSLLQASQYTVLMDGERALYNRLSDIYQGDFSPTMLHRLLAEIPQRLAEKGHPRSKQRFVVFSTAFDELLEQAFQEAGQPFHLFAYRPSFVDEQDIQQAERFLHFLPQTNDDGEGADDNQQDGIQFEKANSYHGHDNDSHPIIVKLCGHRVKRGPDSIAVTEEHYMNYAPAQALDDLLPTTLLNEIKYNSFLFFGHSLQPWHFRLLWQRLRRPNSRTRDPNWAIMPSFDAIEEKFWQNNGIDPIAALPEGVIAYVNDWLDSL